MSTMNSVDNIVVNVDFLRPDRSTIFANEVQVVSGDIAWEDLELMLQIYSGHENIKVSYADDDHDLIVIENEAELQESFKVARKCNNTLKLMVICENPLQARDLLDVEREPLPVPPGDLQLLELSPGRVLYRCGVQDDESWSMLRGASTDERLERDGGTNRREAAAEAEKKPEVDDGREQKSFFIVNKRSPAMVLDVECCGMRRGTRVIVWYRKRAVEGIKNQLWYQDNRTATIRTRLNDFCLDVVDGCLVVNPCDLNSISQKWTFSGNRIQNVFNPKWVIGLKKAELSACDEVLGMAEDELTNVEWTTVDEPKSEFCGKEIGLSCFLSNSAHAFGDGIPTVVAICDICDRVITGVRYKCGFCNDFDMCSACESRDGIHDPTHLLLKMRVPQDQIHLNLSALEPVLIRNADGCVIYDQRIAENQSQRPMDKRDEIPGKEESCCEVIQRTTISQEAEEVEMIHFEKCVKNDVKISVADEEEEEEEEEEAMGHSRSKELFMEEDLLDTRLNQLKTTPTVPSNTPLANTPPQTPAILNLVAKADGTQDTPSSSSSGENPDRVNMAIMADLVYKKMSDIVSDGEYEYVDVDRASNSSSSTDDFFVVPIPDCFNPNLPPRKEASTTVIVKKSAVRGSMRSVDDMLSTSSCLTTEALLSPRCCFSVSPANSEVRNDLAVRKPLQPDEYFLEMDEMRSLDSQPEDIGASGAENTERVDDDESSEGAAVPDFAICQMRELNDNDADAAAADSFENSNSNEVVDANQGSQSEVLNEMQQQQQQQQQEVQQDGVGSDEIPVESECNSNADAVGSQSNGIEASTMKLMSSVFSFVTKTAKDVFSTLQDKNSYIPPRSSWTPAQNLWTPTLSTWTPQQQSAWSPAGTSQWTPAPVSEDAPFPRATEIRSPMDQLIEMGFADRQLNQQLLQSCGDDIETVIQRLVEMNGNIR